MESLDNFKTCELVEELKKREGVEFEYIAPYEKKEITVEGSMIILKIID